MPLSAETIRQVIGLELTHPKTFESCGTIEALFGNPLEHGATKKGFMPFAGDICGNAYVQSEDGGIYLWDHETGLASRIADTWEEFVSWCHEPQSRRWETYDPRWLAGLAETQHPELPWLPAALRACTVGSWSDDKYLHFVDPDRANQPGAAWQFERHIWLKDEKEGNLLLDLLTGNRVGGIEFYDRLFKGE